MANQKLYAILLKYNHSMYYLEPEEVPERDREQYAKYPASGYWTTTSNTRHNPAQHEIMRVILPAESGEEALDKAKKLLDKQVVNINALLGHN